MAGIKSLWVPIRIDGLYVDAEGLRFGSPMADFSRPSYHLSDGSTQNKNLPNLAESAFNQDESLYFGVTMIEGRRDGALHQARGVAPTTDASPSVR